MGKIYDYVNKTAGEINPDDDFFIITNGTEEYNISQTELFNFHLTRNYHLPVNLSNVQDGDVLIYNNSISRWENGVIHAGAEVLNDLNDVVINLPEQKHTIVYNSSGQIWENGNLDIENISNVNINDYQLDDMQPLVFNYTTGWTNYYAGFSGTFITGDSKVCTVVNGLVESVEENWWNGIQEFTPTGDYTGSYATETGWEFIHFE